MGHDTLLNLEVGSEKMEEEQPIDVQEFLGDVEDAVQGQVDVGGIPARAGPVGNNIRDRLIIWNRRKEQVRFASSQVSPN